MLLLPVLVQKTPAPPLPSGWRTLDRVGTRIISVDGTRVAKVEVWVDLPALRHRLGAGAVDGDRARQVLMEGGVRILTVTTYLVDIGPQRRRKRLEAFFAVHWPVPGVDLHRRRIFTRYLDDASAAIGMGDVQIRALEPGWGLWFRRKDAPWRSFGDPDLGLAWVRGEFGREQDPAYALGLEADLAAALAAQRAR